MNGFPLKHLFLTLTLTGLLFFPGVQTPAHATFPGLDIALWDTHQAEQDRSNPRYLKIHELAMEKKFALAIRETEIAIQEHPEKGTPLILKALLLFEQKKYHEAFLTLQRGRLVQPRHPAIHYGHCEMYRQLGDVELADRSCKITVQQHPKSPEAHFEAALTFAGRGHMKEANQMLDIASNLDPENARYHHEKGMNLVYRNESEKAAQSFKKAMALDAMDFDSAYQLGYIYATQGKLDQAKEVLNKVYDSRLDHPQVEASRALLEYLARNDAKDLPSKVDPTRYHLKRARKLYEDKDYGLSLFEIQTAAKMNPEDRPTQEIFVGMTSMLLRLDLAEKAVKHMISISKNDKNMLAKCYQEMGDIMVMRGQIEKARAYYNQSVGLGDPDKIARISLQELPAKGSVPEKPQNPDEWFVQPSEALNRKGEVFSSYGMFERAVAIYSLVLRMDPGHLMSKLNTATAFYDSGKYNKAIALLEKILVSHPKHPHIFSHRVLLAKAYAQKKDREGVIANLQHAKLLRPTGLTLLKSDPVFSSYKDDPVFE